MTDNILVAVDGSQSSARAADEAVKYAKLANANLILAHVIAWSPYSFHTPEELAERHARRESEIDRATEYLLAPEMKRLGSMGVEIKSIVRHGNVGKVLSEIATEENVKQIFIGARGESLIHAALFGSTVLSLVEVATVPVTLVK